MPRHAPLAERFWSQVDTTGDCWVWTGAVNRPGGYGRLKGDGERYAHRQSWTLAKGPIPEGMLVLHHCDNPPCVRPDHLHLGSHEDNAFEMKVRGRAWGNRMHGSQMAQAKLSEEKVVEIRRRRAAGEKPGTLAREFGVTYGTIHAAITRRKWAKVA